MNLRKIFITLLLSIICLQIFLSNGQNGFSYSERITFRDGETHSSIMVSAGTHPGFFFWSLIGFFLFWILLRKTVSIESSQVPSMWRRFWAFMIDFVFSVSVVSPFLVIFPLFLEAKRTGVFLWQFQRNYSTPSDILFLPLTILTMVILFFYFVYPLTKAKPTVGGYLLRIIVTQEDQLVPLTWSRAFNRVFWEMFGLCVWPFTIFKGKDSEGRTWYDKKSGLKVVRFPDKADQDKK